MTGMPGCYRAVGGCAMAETPEAILITGAQRFLPGKGKAGDEPLFIAAGKIRPVPPQLPRKLAVVDASGLVIVPALVDLHVHLREPGMEEAETIASGTMAAAAGGFGAVAAMPNTHPPVDSPRLLEMLRSRAARQAATEVFFTACLTLGREGKTPTRIEQLARCGAAAFTDDGRTVQDDRLTEEIMQRVKGVGLSVWDHAEKAGGHGGVVHEGEVSRRLGLPGIPREVETEMIARRIELCRRTGCRLHIQHVSTAEGVKLIEEARRLGLPVSGEVTPHHLALCEDDITGPDPRFKMNPPLRSRGDRDALRRGVREGVIQAFATDHAPHTVESKSRGMHAAPFGVVGLETAVGVTYTVMVVEEGMSVAEWLARWISGPREVLGLAEPTLAVGENADVVVLDLEREWMVDSTRFLSRSRNTPFEGRRLRGRAVLNIHRGRIIWCEEGFRSRVRSSG